MRKTRISKIHGHLRLNHQNQNPSTLKTIPFPQATQLGRVREALAVAAEIVNHWLVFQEKPLKDVVPNRLVRYFLRWVYWRYGFAAKSCRCKHGVTYFNFEPRGTFPNEADARWLANCDGGGLKQIPFNAALGEETGQYSACDFPQSEASAEYRHRRLPFSFVPTVELERLAEIKQRTDSLIEEYRQSA